MVTFLEIVDSGVKIGLGASIAGLSGYYLAKQKYAEEKRISQDDETRTIYKEIALKLESIESSFRTAEHHYHADNLTEARKVIVVALEQALAICAMSNLAGDDDLVIHFEELVLVIQKAFMELTSDDINPDKMDEIEKAQTRIKKDAYPLIRIGFNLRYKK